MASPAKIGHKQPVAYYSLHGAGTATEPAYLSFNFGATRDPGFQFISGQLPPIVVLELRRHREFTGYELRGRHKEMSRTDLLRVFYDLIEDSCWLHRGFN